MNVITFSIHWLCHWVTVMDSYMLIHKWYSVIQFRLFRFYGPKYPVGPQLNTKMSSYQYRKSYGGDKTVIRSSYLHNGKLGEWSKWPLNSESHCYDNTLIYTKYITPFKSLYMNSVNLTTVSNIFFNHDISCQQLLHFHWSNLWYTGKTGQYQTTQKHLA